MDYLDQDFIKLKYNDTSTSIIWRDQSHLDPHIDFSSTWLYPIAFRHCIKNSDSLVSKHSELLASHYGDLRTEGYLCPYTSRAALDSRVFNRWVTCSVTISPTSHLYAIPVSPYSLVKRTTNLYGTQRLSLDKHHHPLTMYHLVANIFKNYMINSLLSITL